MVRTFIVYELLIIQPDISIIKHDDFTALLEKVLTLEERIPGWKLIQPFGVLYSITLKETT